MYRIIGYEHKSGINKKDKPYDIHIFHCVVEGSIASPGVGDRVESVIYNALINGEIDFSPSVGDYIKVLYNRQGFVSSVSLA